MDDFNRGSDLFSIEVDEHTKVAFLEMARWTKFLAILGFIGLGLATAGVFFAIALAASTNLAGPVGVLGTTSVMLIYLLIIAVCIYPFYGLIRYSTNMKAALSAQDKTKFNAAITYLKNVFKYYGIVAIIMLGMYGLIMILSLLISFMG